MLKRCLGTENQVGRGSSQIKEAPVHPLIHTGVLRDGRLGLRGTGHLEGVDFHFQTAEFHALVELQFTGHVDKGSGREQRNGVRQGSTLRRGPCFGVVFAESRVHQLGATGLIPQDDELHLFLVADCLNETPHRHSGAIGRLGKVGNAGASGHESRV